MSAHSAARHHKSRLEELGDFTTTASVIPISLIAIVIGVIGRVYCVVSVKAYRYFYQPVLLSSIQHLIRVACRKSSRRLCDPCPGCRVIDCRHHGALRLGAHPWPRHPRGNRIDPDEGQPRRPKVAILKPVSSAIAIGSGGPFGAEGPIIMTGGAFGSIVAQFIHLTTPSARRCWSPAPQAVCRPCSTRRSPPCSSPWNCCSSNGSHAA